MFGDPNFGVLAGGVVFGDPNFGPVDGLPGLDAVVGATEDFEEPPNFDVEDGGVTGLLELLVLGDPNFGPVEGRATEGFEELLVEGLEPPKMLPPLDGLLEDRDDPPKDLLLEEREEELRPPFWA